MRVVNNKVERLLEKDQLYRDSDKKLLIAFWRQEGFHLTPTQEAQFMRCTPAESVTRARRALKAKYPASPKIEQERYEKFQEYKQESLTW